MDHTLTPANRICGVAVVLGILAWIRYTLSTTPPPKPVEEIGRELEGELKKLEDEARNRAVKRNYEWIEYSGDPV